MTNARKPCASDSISDKTGIQRLEVVNRPVAALRPDSKNPRRHDRRQVQQIARSIAAFGFNVPVLIDAEGNVIAGHGRVLAACELGFKEVPTIRLDHLSAAQNRAFMIADNRLTEISAWDDQLLAEQLQELSILDLEFDLEAIGFAVGEIELRIEGANEAALQAPSLPSPASGGGKCKSGNRRQARLAEREAGVAEREAKLAEREASLAAWEASLVEREAMLEAAHA